MKIRGRMPLKQQADLARLRSETDHRLMVRVIHADDHVMVFQIVISNLARGGIDAMPSAFSFRAAPRVGSVPLMPTSGTCTVHFKP